MPFQCWRLSLPLSLLLLPCLAPASSIRINGTCVVGTCTSGPGDALQMGQSEGPTTGSSPLVINLDSFQIDWTYSAFYDANGTHLTVTPTVTYLGLTPSVGNDMITFEYFQNFYDPQPGAWIGSYTEIVPLTLSANAGPGSTISAELSYDTFGLGLVGPYGPGTYTETHTRDLSGLINPADPTLAALFTFNFHFMPGTTNNSFGTSPASVPEPSQAVPAGLALLGGLWHVAARRRRRTQ